MKYQKIIDELNDLLDQQQQHQEVVGAYKKRFATKEQKLRRKLESEDNDDSRSKLGAQLDMVRAGYALLKINDGPERA